jgi:hypothetical protein
VEFHLDVAPARLAAVHLPGGPYTLAAYRRVALSVFLRSLRAETMKIGDLMMRLFHARTVTHVMHLKTRSYAAHVALGEFYDAVVDRADTIAEMYQGRYGLIECAAAPYEYSDDAVPYLLRLRKWIEGNRDEICDCREVQNEIDTLLGLIDSTIYKLKFLS